MNLVASLTLGLLVCLAALLAWAGQRALRRAREAEAAARSNEALLGALQLCARSMPIWVKQIETVRAQTESSVNGQVQRFSTLVDRLERTLAESRKVAGTLAAEGGEALPGTLSRGREDLAGVVQTLLGSVRSRNEMMDAIGVLARHADEIQGSAVEISAIAKQTQLLAYNAAIEASRAGEGGRSFTIVAGELRSLSDRAETTGKQIVGMSERVSNAIRGVLKDAARFRTEDDHAVKGAESSIAGVLGDFQETGTRLASSAHLLQVEGAGIRDEISNVLVSLQYQDRVSQILTHVTAGMEELHERLRAAGAGDAGGGDAEFFDRMKSAYSTDEERRGHDDAMRFAALPQPSPALR